jgi:predicted  nucleic acid-binding Zn-ribbon protein
MFCPKCGYEYEKKLTECPDCGSKLIDRLPEKKDPEWVDLVTVYESENLSDLLVAKSLLEDAQIDFFPHGDGIIELFGGVSPVVGVVEIQVREEDEQAALEVLTDLSESEDHESP